MCGYIYHFVLLMGWCVCGGCAVGTHETNHGDGFSRARSMEILSRPKTAHTYLVQRLRYLFNFRVCRRHENSGVNGVVYDFQVLQRSI